jgi:hypothetical protein
MADHLYWGVLSHDARVKVMEEPILRALKAADLNFDMTTTVVVTAGSRLEAQNRVFEHFDIRTPMHLIPSGLATALPGKHELLGAAGIRGNIKWDELEKCPECTYGELRHDASQGCTDCISCGWSFDWTVGTDG